MNCDGTKRLEHVLGFSLEYILSQQQQDGCWVDWKLPPGESSIWTTAFVGCKLRSLTFGLRERASVSIRLASDWLDEKMFPDSGWGYNEQVDSDADSTALAILFLASVGRNVNEACYACLRSFQCCDGGFATYRGQPGLGSWAVSHADVTPSAIFAMMTKYGAESETVDRGLEFVLNHRTSTGIWQSFWWTSFLYSTEGSLSLLKAVGLKTDLQGTLESLRDTRPQNPFEAALLVSSLLSLPRTSRDKDIWPLVDELMEDQEPDGSWRTGPMLRVSRRDCLLAYKPGDPDQVFCDQNRLFTTATVLDALSRVCSLL
jgi:squalene cyclase